MVKIDLPTNLTGIGSLMSYTNDVTDGGVGIIMPFVLVIMVFVITLTKSQNTAQAFTVACFTGMISSLVLLAVGITPILYVLLWGTFTIIGAIFIRP